MDPATDSILAEGDQHGLSLPSDADVLQVDQLQALLQRLDARATNVLDSMNAVLQSHQPQFTGVFENARDLGNRVTQLQAELKHNMAAIAGSDSIRGVQVSARVNSDQQRAQLAHIQRTVQALTHLNELKNLLESADEAMGVGNRFDAVRAADLLDECNAPFTALRDDIEKDIDIATSPTSRGAGDIDPRWSQSQVLRAVETQIRRRKTKLRMRMEQVLAEAVVMSPGSLSVRNHILAALGTHANALSLGDVLHCLDTLGVLEAKLTTTLAPQLLTHIFAKLLNPPPSPQNQPNDDSSTTLEFTPRATRAGAYDISKLQGNARMTIVHDADMANSTGVSLTVRKRADTATHSASMSTSMSVTDLCLIFDDVAEAIEFLHRHIANGDANHMRALAKSLWLPSGRHLSSGIAVGLLRAVRRTVPHASQNAQSICTQVQDAAEAFEAKLVELGFLDPSDTSAVDALDAYVSSHPRSSQSKRESSSSTEARGTANVELGKALVANPRARVLTSFARDMDRHIALAKRAYILDLARSICSQEYPNAINACNTISRFPILTHIQTQEREVFSQSTLPTSSPTDGVVYQLPEMQVSTAVVELMELVHSTMAEAAALTHLIASSTLYHTARDVCVLLEAVLPLVHEQQLSTDPAASMVFHNDLVYAVHHLAVLAHAFRDTFVIVSLRPRIVTVDLIPGIRKHADNLLRSEVDKQTRKVVELARATPDLRLLPEELSRFEQTFNSSISMFCKVVQGWAKVLSPQDLTRSAAHMADEFITVMLDKLRLLSSPSLPQERRLDERDVRNLHFFYQSLSEKVMHVVDGKGKMVSLRMHVQRGGKQLAGVVHVLEPHVTATTFEDMRARGVLAAVDPQLVDTLQMARYASLLR